MKGPGYVLAAEPGVGRPLLCAVGRPWNWPTARRRMRFACCTTASSSAGNASAPYDAARARLLLASAMSLAGDTRWGMRDVRAARSCFDSLGARLDAAGAATLGRARGRRCRPAERVSAPSAGPATRSERIPPPTWPARYQRTIALPALACRVRRLGW